MKRSTAPLAAASAIMLLCGFYNTIFNVLRRATHLLGTVREAARLETDYTDPEEWKSLALSVYDLVVIVRLSSGILAAVQIAAAAVGLIYAALYAFREKPPRGMWLPAVLGALCLAAGAVSVASSAVTQSTGVFLIFVLSITEVLVPLGYVIAAGKFKSSV